MTFLPYAVVVVITVAGIYGVATSRNLVHMVICLSVLQSATLVLLLAMGYRTGAQAPIISTARGSRHAVDPVVQALTLTDVVVGATVVALLLALVVQAHKRSGTLDPDELRPFRG